jgi:hypothetical protein
MAKAKRKAKEIGRKIGETIGSEIDKEIEKEKCGEKRYAHNNGGNAVYGIGLIGALIFYIQHATSFGAGLLGVLKAIVWPAIVVYKFLGM